MNPDRKQSNAQKRTKQQERFDDLEAEVGNLAYFYCCVAFDVIFVPELIPEAATIEENGWALYCARLRDTGADRDDETGAKLRFLDGETDIREFIADTGDGMPGTRLQRETWGTGPEKTPYTDADYKRLDDLFKIMSARLVSAGGYDDQQEYILRRCAVMSLEQEKALAAGSIEKVKKLNDVIQANLASESLRKKDEKPLEDLRVDSIVDALEKAGMVKAGKILPLSELKTQLLKHMGLVGGVASHKYPYTLDAADQMIQIIINTMRANDGLPEITELADNMKFDVNVAPEFEGNASQTERKIYKELGLVPQRYDTISQWDVDDGEEE